VVVAVVVVEYQSGRADPRKAEWSRDGGKTRSELDCSMISATNHLTSTLRGFIDDTSGCDRMNLHRPSIDGVIIR